MGPKYTLYRADCLKIPKNNIKISVLFLDKSTSISICSLKILNAVSVYYWYLFKYFFFQLSMSVFKKWTLFLTDLFFCTSMNYKITLSKTPFIFQDFCIVLVTDYRKSIDETKSKLFFIFFLVLNLIIS